MRIFLWEGVLEEKRSLVKWGLVAQAKDEGAYDWHRWHGRVRLCIGSSYCIFYNRESVRVAVIRS